MYPWIIISNYQAFLYVKTILGIFGGAFVDFLSEEIIDDEANSWAYFALVLLIMNVGILTFSSFLLGLAFTLF